MVSQSLTKETFSPMNSNMDQEPRGNSTTRCKLSIPHQMPYSPGTENALNTRGIPGGGGGVLKV